LVTFFLWALFFVAGYSQTRVQVLNRDATLKMARDSQRYEMSKVDYAKRGDILSADGKPLAEDQDAYVLSVNLSRVPKTEAFFMDLSQASGIPAAEFAQAAGAGLKGRIWPQDISTTQAEEIQRVKNSWRADGVSLQRMERRAYPLGSAAASVVGVIRQGQAVAGLEQAQNSKLGGVNGKTIGLLDRQGAFLPMRVESGSTEKVDGEPILTTIDSDLQMVSARVVKDAVRSSGAHEGAAVVMDPRTGDVLAMACYPTYEPATRANVAKAEAQESDLNVCTQARLEPGSMFKILTLAKAIDMGVTNPNRAERCQGYMKIGKSEPFHCDRNEKHGYVTPIHAIARSCNIAAANWALEIGRDPMVDYIHRLGLLQPTHLGLPGEVKGQFREDEYAWKLQLAHVGFGQSITATPIGLASAFCAIGNGGVRMQPRLVQKIGKQTNPVRALGQIVKPASADFVRHCMEAVIQTDEGTGSHLRIPGYTLAGKTGTAQKVGRGNGHVSNFVGFVPSENPRAVILVMIDDPKTKSYYGAQLAGPAFLQIAKSVIRRYDILADGVVPTTRSQWIGQPVKVLAKKP
jgi:cell division protein FtsI (penicillin-binding protein 3)